MKSFFEDARAHEFSPRNEERRIEHGYYETVEKDHGRIETRRCWMVTGLDWLEQKDEWAGNAAVSTALAKQAAGVPEANDWPDPFRNEALQMVVGKIAEIQRGEQLVSTGQFAEAITQMQQIVAQYPDAARAWMLLGAAYTGSGDPAAGESALRKSLSLDPNSIECTNHLGNALAREGHISEAAACFTKALAGSPRSAEYHFNLGVCLYLQHKTAAAIQEFKAAVQIEPNAVKNHASLGDALAQGHQTAAAIQQYQIGLKLHPRDRILERSLARLQNAPAH